ncbi:MAG: helix-turn-helix transcriptional regulator [Gammaproteobacteria bacterium]|nr:helix-turn-helix transcriptional regulator [Gammaproteobacteria bacterium]
MTLVYQRKVCKDVLTICEPLINFFNVNFFAHVRAFHDGGFASLITRPELGEHYITQKYPIQFSGGNGIVLANGFYVVSGNSDIYTIKIAGDLRERFNTDHFVCIIDKQKDFDDMFSLATTPDNTYILNKYINNLDLLNQFLLYYKEKSKSLIAKSKVARYSSEHFGATTQPMPCNIADREAFIQTMPLNKITLRGNLGDAVISKRELDCLKLIIKCYSFKQIGKTLDISPRTVETYVNTLKSKLGCDTKLELVNLVFSLKHPCLY